MHAPAIDLLSHVATPLIILDGSGESLGGNTVGQERFAALKENINFGTWFALAWEQTAKMPWLTKVPQGAKAADSAEEANTASHSDILRLTQIQASQAEEPLLLIEWAITTDSQSLQLLQEVSRAVNSSLILEDIFESLADVLLPFIPYATFRIVILDETQNGVKLLVECDNNGNLTLSGEHHLFTGSDPIIDRLLKEQRPLHIQDPRSAQSLLFSTSASNPALVTPLINKGVVIGILAFETDQPQGFSSTHETLILQLGEPLAIAVENAKLYWQTQQQASREYLMNQLTTAIRQSLELENILKTAADELGQVTGVSRCIIHYIPTDPTRNAPIHVHYSRPGFSTSLTGPEEQQTLAQFEALSCTVFKKRSLKKDQLSGTWFPFVLNQVQDCPESLIPQAFFQTHQIQSMAIFPIVLEEQIDNHLEEQLVGSITLHQCDSLRSWVPEDIQLFQAISEQLGVALKQANMFLTLGRQKSVLENTLSELQETQFQLIQSEKMAVLGQFVAGIAHEVNTPLGSMMSNTTTLDHCVDTLQQNPSPEKTTKLLDSMKSLLSINKMAAERILEIVRNLRNFARLDESELKAVDIHEGIDNTLILMRSSLFPHVNIIKHYGTDLPPVTCYPGLLNQVFMNILVNANHALEGLPTGQISIETHYDKAERTVSVLFTDTGKGIQPEHLAKLFDPGFTTKGRGVGTGLGLALCYKIIQKHGGEIRVSSEPNAGARFTVIIPLEPPKGH